MKLTDHKKVSAAIEKYNALAENLTLVSSGKVMISFGDPEEPSRDWFTVSVAQAISTELRDRVRNSLILDMEKLKSEMEELGVEL